MQSKPSEFANWSEYQDGTPPLMLAEPEENIGWTMEVEQASYTTPEGRRAVWL